MRKVVILSFDSGNNAEEAAKKIRQKEETPQTLLESSLQIGLVHFGEAETFTAFRQDLQRLPPAAKRTIFVGESDEGDYEVLHNHGAVRSWLYGQE